jgi:molybdopterin-guanine dinucleotide biosynthesis protein A
MSVFGYVQAGGGSTRFGIDKALVEFNGKSMLERTCALLMPLCKTVRIIAPSEKYPQAPVPIITDRWPGEGPLGGIVTALYHADDMSRALAQVPGMAEEARGHCIILSCDMPFLSHDFMVFLREHAVRSKAEVVVANSTNGLEPLCACWRTDAVKDLHRTFERGVRRVTEAMKRLKMEVLDEPVWKRFDSDGRLFWNMNTPEDYELARKILEPKKDDGPIPWR